MTPRPPPPAPSRRRRRGRVILVALLVVFVALWCGYWYATNRMVTSALASMSSSFAARGQAVTCGEGAVGGFPLSLDLDCGGPTFADASAGISAALGGITASAPLYWPGSVSTALTGPFDIKAPALGLDLNAAWKAARATAEAGLSGLTSAAATFDDLAVTNDGATTTLPLVAFSAAHASVGARPAGGGDYRFTAEGDSVAVKPADGRALPEVDAVVSIRAIGFGSALGTDPAKALAAWLAAGGALEVERLTLASGTSSATATGTLSVSDKGLVSGNLNLRLVGLAAVPDLFPDLRPKQRNKMAQAIAALNAFTKPVEDDPTARDAPLSIRNGVMMIGFIPLGEIPPLKLR